MSKHRFVITVNIPDGVSEGIDNEYLAEYILDAISTWYGQEDPNSCLWCLRDARFQAQYRHNKQQGKLVLDKTGEKNYVYKRLG